MGQIPMRLARERSGPVMGYSIFGCYLPVKA
jgi:hypothetical protein